jgi:hypothetical protein
MRYGGKRHSGYGPEAPEEKNRTMKGLSLKESRKSGNERCSEERKMSEESRKNAGRTAVELHGTLIARKRRLQLAEFPSWLPS